MTLCLACASPQGLVIASDQLTLVHHDIHMVDKKWVKLGNWRIGVSGNWAYHQAVQFWGDEPPPTNIESLVAALRRAFARHGFVAEKQNGIDDHPMRMIAAMGDVIYVIGSDLVAMTVKKGDWAVIGSAEDVARGAIAGLKYFQDLPAADVAKIVMDIVSEHHIAVKGFWCETIALNARTARAMEENEQFVMRHGRGPIEVPE